MATPRHTLPRLRSTTPTQASTAAAIADRRVALHLTQQTLADLAGVSRSTVQAIEYGRTSVSLDAFLAVLDALGLRITVAVKGASE